MMESTEKMVRSEERTSSSQVAGPGEPTPAPAEMGASISSCLRRMAEFFGIRVCDRGLEWDGSTQLRHFVHAQASNMGLGAEISARPARFEAKDLPALVKYADGSFAVIEKRRGRMLEAWNGASFRLPNTPDALEQFEDWACTFGAPCETDTVPFLSLAWFTRQPPAWIKE